MNDHITLRVAKTQAALCAMTPAERMELLLAFKRGFSHNYTAAPVASKVVKVAGSRFATA